MKWTTEYDEDVKYKTFNAEWTDGDSWYIWQFQDKTVI